MKRELYAAALIFFAFVSGMLLTAATSGCDGGSQTQAAAEQIAK